MTPLFDDLKTLEFQSPTFGCIDFETVFAKLVGYIEEDPSQRYNLIIGSDSFRSVETIFVSAIVIHKVGHGGRYFYRKRRAGKVRSLRHRIIYETTMSIELALGPGAKTFREWLRRTAGRDSFRRRNEWRDEEYY